MNYNPEKSKGDRYLLNNSAEEFVNYGSNGLLLIKNKTLPSIKLITKQEYLQKNIWGLLTSIDLFDCNLEILKSGEKIKEHIVELCKIIGVKRFGEPLIIRFGSDPKVYGYSSAQLIETSLISGHYAEESNSVYIDIFSCKWYDQEKAVEFTKNFFKAKKVEFNVLPRGRSIA